MVLLTGSDMDKKNKGKLTMKSSKPINHPASEAVSGRPTDAKPKGYKQHDRKTPVTAHSESITLTKYKHLCQKSSINCALRGDLNSKKANAPNILTAKASLLFPSPQQRLQTVRGSSDLMRTPSRPTDLSAADRLPKLRVTSQPEKGLPKPRGRPAARPRISQSEKGSSSPNVPKVKVDVAYSLNRPKEQNRQLMSTVPYKKPQLPSVYQQSTRSRSRQTWKALDESEDGKTSSTLRKVKKANVKLSSHTQLAEKQRQENLSGPVTSALGNDNETWANGAQGDTQKLAPCAATSMIQEKTKTIERFPETKYSQPVKKKEIRQKEKLPERLKNINSIEIPRAKPAVQKTSSTVRMSRPNSASVLKVKVGSASRNFSAILRQTLKMAQIVGKTDEEIISEDAVLQAPIKMDNVDNLPFPQPNTKYSETEEDVVNPPVNTPESPRSPTSDIPSLANDSSSREDSSRKVSESEDGNDHLLGKDRDTSAHDFVSDYLQLESMKQANHIAQTMCRANICSRISGADPNLTLENLKMTKSHYLQLPCFADPKYFARIRIPPHILLFGRVMDKDLLTIHYLQTKMDSLCRQNFESINAEQKRSAQSVTAQAPSLPCQNHSSNANFSKDSYLQSFQRLYQSAHLHDWAKNSSELEQMGCDDEEEMKYETYKMEENQIKPTTSEGEERTAVVQKILQMFQHGKLSKSKQSAESMDLTLKDSKGTSMKDYSDGDGLSDSENLPDSA